MPQGSKYRLRRQIWQERILDTPRRRTGMAKGDPLRPMNRKFRTLLDERGIIKCPRGPEREMPPLAHIMSPNILSDERHRFPQLALKKFSRGSKRIESILELPRLCSTYLSTEDHLQVWKLYSSDLLRNIFLLIDSKCILAIICGRSGCADRTSSLSDS